VIPTQDDRDDETRLIGCFRQVFPRLRDDEIRAASMKRLGAWDSAALLRLLASVERAFDVRLEQAHVNRMISFSDILSVLRSWPRQPIAPPRGRQRSDHLRLAPE
jgi:acyl carrier protein